MYFYIFKFSIIRLVGIKGNNNLENVQIQSVQIQNKLFYPVTHESIS